MVLQAFGVTWAMSHLRAFVANQVLSRIHFSGSFCPDFYLDIEDFTQILCRYVPKKLAAKTSAQKQKKEWQSVGCVAYKKKNNERQAPKAASDSDISPVCFSSPERSINLDPHGDEFRAGEENRINLTNHHQIFKNIK